VRLGALASLVETLIERDMLAAAEETLEADADLLNSPFITALQCHYARGRLRAAHGRQEEGWRTCSSAGSAAAGSSLRACRGPRGARMRR
jgi:hypothetical protein